MSDLDQQSSGDDFWEADERDEDEDDDPLHEWVIDCGDPNCCMNFAPHFRSECYTPEMYESMLMCDSPDTSGAERG